MKLLNNTIKKNQVQIHFHMNNDNGNKNIKIEGLNRFSNKTDIYAKNHFHENTCQI